MYQFLRYARPVSKATAAAAAVWIWGSSTTALASSATPASAAPTPAQPYDAAAVAAESAAALQGLAGMFDHTQLKPTAQPSDIQALLQQAIEHQFASVCIHPTYLPMAAQALKAAGSPARPVLCTVVGFPLGACSTPAKVADTEYALDQGAKEIDMVVNIAAVISGTQDAEVQADIAAVVAAAHARGALVKVILETCLLNPEQRDRAVKLATAAGADFVKTSTGFSTGGATANDVAAMAVVAEAEARRLQRTPPAVKASGGIRTLVDAVAMRDAGATRLGASASVSIMQEAQELAQLSPATWARLWKVGGKLAPASGQALAEPTVWPHRGSREHVQALGQAPSEPVASY